MSAPIFNEPFEYPVEKFKEHLSDDATNRILFSGKYGIGKTMFLNAFFLEESQNKLFGKVQYEVYRLSPVNYAIAPNEDIVDFIKYDIILEFLRKGFSFEEKGFTYLDTLPTFLKKNLLAVALELVRMIPEVGKEIVETHEKIMALYKKSQAFQAAANASDGDALADHVSRIESTKGNPYVVDLVTNIIRHVINGEKAADNKMESILIIDDLDRLDPEHIFRLLNIFSVHFGDHPNEAIGNKFGFKKVLLVCDYHNIRHIFHHRYGHYTDFSGYIDKFYSTSVFHFDNRVAILEVIRKVFDSFTYPHNQHDLRVAQQVLLEDNFIYEIVAILVEHRFVSFRNITKQYGTPITLHNKSLDFGAPAGDIGAFKLRPAVQLALLSAIVGDAVTLDRAIDKCLADRIPFAGQEDAIGLLVMVATYKQGLYLQRYRAASPAMPAQWNGKPYVIKPNIRGGMAISAQLFIANAGGDVVEEPIAEPDLFWQALKEALAVLRLIRFIP